MTESEVDHVNVTNLSDSVVWYWRLCEDVYILLSLSVRVRPSIIRWYISACSAGLSGISRMPWDLN